MRGAARLSRLLRHQSKIDLWSNERLHQRVKGLAFKTWVAPLTGRTSAAFCDSIGLIHA